MTTTCIQDLDEEILLRHFCLEAEAAHVTSWCEEHCARSTSSGAERIATALKLKDKGNLALKGDKALAALHIYLAALHHCDFSESAKAQLLKTDDDKSELRAATLVVLLNLSLAFLKKEDFYNTDRAATLGLWFAEKQRTREDGQERARAKLLYRRALSRFKGATGDAAPVG